jgi:lipoprotein NlpD
LRKIAILLLLPLITGIGACAYNPKYAGKPRLVKQRLHLVKRGDTLFEIAKKYGVSVSSIKRKNSLKSSTISPGQRLSIPSKRSSNRRGTLRKSVQRKTSKKKLGKKDIPPLKAPKITVRLSWPIKDKMTITSKFGVRKNGKHDGIDLAANRGVKILAAADGTVLFSGYGPTGYGLTVLIKHTDNVFTVYSHNDKNLVKKGKRVKRGQAIATVGKTGRASGDHLHFEVRVNRVAYNPLSYLPKRK